MNLSAPAFIVVLTGVFGAGGLLVAVLNAAVGRGGRRADVASKITEAAGGIIERLEHELERLDDVQEACDRCNARLTVTERRLTDSEEQHRKTKAALRVLIRVIDTADQNAIDEAIAAARQLI